MYKVKEARQLLQNKYQLLTLRDIGCEEELPETQRTIAGNAMQKALYVFEKYGQNCIADDTGLEVAALGGRPGVYSARYAGAHATAESNMRKLLTEMKGETNRDALFRTVIALIIDDQRFAFEGVIEGTIAYEPIGDGGFGYDPIFVPKQSNLSFAQMSPEEKNKLSHRAIAVNELYKHLLLQQQFIK